MVAGRDQLLLSGGEKIVSYDPETGGNRLWETTGTTAATCGTVVWEGDIVVASGGYPGIGNRGDSRGRNRECRLEE
jgi:outer membrane protein assembly factor BamB